MASKAKAVLDACVLHPFHLRNLFLQLAVDDAIDLFWSDEISREWLRSDSKTVVTAPMDRLIGQLARMNAVLPNANVQGWERHVEDIRGLPDEADRHVVAAAMQAGDLDRALEKLALVAVDGKVTSSPGTSPISRNPLSNRRSWSQLIRTTF